MELLTPLLKAMDRVSSEVQIIRFGMEMCNALEACQKRKVIHRDIKPQNIFVSDDGVFKLGDFGIARKAEKTTRATVGKDTYQFMAPEVKNELSYGPTVDMYSLGLVMYWLLNDRRCPFFPLPPAVPTHKEEQEALRRRFSGEKIPAPKNGTAELKQIVLKACAFDPKDRYQSAREMREDLAHLSGEYKFMPISQPMPDPETAPEPAFDNETVGPDFIRISNSDQDDLDKTVGPIFRHNIVDGLGESGKSNFSSKTNIEKKKTREQKKTKTIVAVALIAVCTLFLVFYCFGENKSVEGRLETNEGIIESGVEDRSAEVDELILEADRLAAEYWYCEAIELLESFGTDDQQYPKIAERIAAYEEQMSRLTAFSNVSSIPNLSFNVLIADPSRAFADEDLGTSYAKNYITISEFEKILEQLYLNNYILVNLTDVICPNAATGELEVNQLMLPAGKKPIILTETVVNYFRYMIDSDKDGYADAGGNGFASRLVVRNGEIEAEYVDAFGNTHIGNFDFVPILEDFIKQHPDFSYHGARAILAVTGVEGVFGYRVNPSYYVTMGQDYVDNQIAQAKELVGVLREKGYNIACNTYGNSDYQSFSSNQIQSEMQLWNDEIQPVLGNIDMIVFAHKRGLGDYTGSKLNVLLDNGFRYLISEGSSEQNQVEYSYFQQNKLTITGEILCNQPDLLSSFFDADKTLIDQRREEQKQLAEEMRPEAEAALPDIDETFSVVEEVLPLKLKYNDATISAIEGLNFTIYDGPIDVSEINWSVDRSGVVRVENGIITVIGTGTATVYAEYNGEVASVIIRVKE